MSEPEYGGYPLSCIEKGHFQLEGEQVMAIVNDLLRDLAAANAENAVLRDAIKDALPWMIKLGDYIGNGTQADPMGRCNAILKMRIAVEKRDD